MEDKTYTCQICHHINHVARLHCQVCGVIPACYSATGQAMTAYGIPITAAKGCDRTESHRTVKANLRTVPLDYYGEGAK